MFQERLEGGDTHEPSKNGLFDLFCTAHPLGHRLQSGESSPGLKADSAVAANFTSGEGSGHPRLKTSGRCLGEASGRGVHPSPFQVPTYPPTRGLRGSIV